MLVKFTLTHLWNCERFEPRSHFKRRLSLIIRVNVVLNRAVVVDRDWRFDNLCGSHLQSKSTSLWLWKWLLHRLSKCQSLSTRTVLFRTTFTWTIKLNLLLTFVKVDAQIEEECPRTIYYLTYTRLHCKKLSNQKSTFGGQLHTNVCILSTQALHWCLCSHYKLDSQICLHTVTITAQIALGPTVIINLISWTK